MFDANDGTWTEVINYCQQRIGELTELCCDPDAIADVRQNSAQRIDELKQLITMPQERRERQALEEAAKLPAIPRY